MPRLAGGLLGPACPPRRGRGFEYLDEASGDAAERIRVVIPPAWTDVWICPTRTATSRRWAPTPPGGASTSTTPTGAAARPREVRRDGAIRPGSPPPRACARPAPARARRERCSPARPTARPRLLPHRHRGLRRGEQDVRARHHAAAPRDLEHGDVRFDYRSKGGKRRSSRRRPTSASSRRSCAGGRAGAARLEGGAQLGGRRLRRHQRLHQGGHRGRLLGQGLPHLERDRARGGGARGLGRGARLQDARTRAISRAVQEVAHYLGNTPAVCRASTSTRASSTASATASRSAARSTSSARSPTASPRRQGAIEEAVLDLLERDLDSPALERVALQAYPSASASAPAGRISTLKDRDLPPSGRARSSPEA